MQISRYIPVILSSMIMVLFVGCSSPKEKETAESVSNLDNHIEVIYFHGNMRCLSCRAIEKFAKETVDSLFTDEKKAGKVIFKVVDVSENEALADSYQTTGSSLYVTTFCNGKESRKDMTEFGFRTARKQHQLFQDSLASTIRNSLKNIAP